MNDLIEKPATQIVELLRSEKVSPHDLLDALEQRIELVEPSVNALPTRFFKQARENADCLLKKPIKERGLLAGLPLTIKDLMEVSGQRTTFGSLIYADHISNKSDLLVEKLETEGGIVYAKSNTPEFGAGANTFNDVFGSTCNPWDLTKSAAGSSGGAAASLASGTSWLSHGSDNAGSLRTPASFCGIVGLRPSMGRVAYGPALDPYQSLSTQGPMARNVEDVALFLDAMSGANPFTPMSLSKPDMSFLKAAQNRLLPKKIAYSPDLGITPVDPEIVEITRRAAEKFIEMGVVVEEASPDFSGVHETYQTLRALGFAVSYGGILDKNRDRIKPEVIGNIERGLNLTAESIAMAMRERGKIRQRVVGFFQEFDLVLAPAAIVPPYPVEQRYIESCNGYTFDTYIDWLAISYAATLVSLPALSIPCGFTKSQLPVGLQIIGRPFGDGDLLAAAVNLEDALGLDLRPILPKESSGSGDE